MSDWPPAEPAGGRWLAAPNLAQLLVVLAGASAVMLLPRLFGDPMSVDPDAWRLSAYFAVVCAGSLLIPRLRGRLPMHLALLTVALPYSASMWLLGYQGPLGQYLGPAYGDARNAWSGLAWLLLALLLALLFRFATSPPRRPLRLLSRPGRSALPWAIGGSLLFLILAFLLPGPLIGREGVPLLSLGGSAGVSLGIANAASAVAQEVQFRAVLLVALEREQPPRVALVAQALIFAVAHLVVAGPVATLIPVVLLLGLLWGYMTQRSRSILPACVAHIVADLFLLAAIVPGLYGA